MKLLFSLVIVLLTIEYQSYFAKVVRIIDGDSIMILTNDNQQIKVRLEGIDCPEKSQDFGEKARQYTADLCFNKVVRIEKTGKDRYGRILAYIYVDDLCVNKELLKVGLAWHFKKYNADPELAKLEKQARSEKKGLWAQPSPTPPWEFRKK
jgi:endonuclease YncB( thermonuclease family)